ncbi:MAG: M48 family metallopeptidase [Balneolales bacterium]|nr:M48 family metallopeptidase [Balneolales bacterium]
MDFFKAQDDARRNTGKLLFFYLLAVLGLIISIYLVSWALFAGSGAAEPGTLAFWNPVLFTSIATITLLIIGAGSAYRIISLRKGGRAVAEMMGARLVESSTKDPDERKLMNIIEEMSIASGIPVPAVYILDQENSINAFAAGYTPNDAAVGVTLGCIRLLSRDQLQGVIAHEFSHIFNGDMKLNIRLIGILNGILIIHLLGAVLMRAQFYSNIGRSGRNDQKGRLAILVFGIALMFIGYMGVIFGRMIQAAVSRQREYLADAAAVQYTRNPDGIAGALLAIKNHSEGSQIKEAHAAEFSHLFFSSGHKSWLNSMMATHPPINKRIEAIKASFMMEMSGERASKKFNHEQDSGKKKSGDSGSDKFDKIVKGSMLIMAAGNPAASHLTAARKMLDELPETVTVALRETDGARALVAGLLLSPEDSTREKQHLICENYDSSIYAEAELHQKALSSKPAYVHIALAELCINPLRTLKKADSVAFTGFLKELINADGKVDLLEFCLEEIIVNSLLRYHKNGKEEKVIYTSIHELIPELNVLLSAVALRAGNPQKAFQTSSEIIITSSDREFELTLLTSESLTNERLRLALEAFRKASGELKNSMLHGLAEGMIHDRKINEEELSLFRAIAASVEVPIPFIMPDKLLS